MLRASNLSLVLGSVKHFERLGKVASAVSEFDSFELVPHTVVSAAADSDFHLLAYCLAS